MTEPTKEKLEKEEKKEEKKEENKDGKPMKINEMMKTMPQRKKKAGLFAAIHKRRKIVKKKPIKLPYKKWFDTYQSKNNSDKNNEKKNDNNNADNIKYVSITCLSDTHMGHKKLNIPKADICVLSGDFTQYGTIKEAKIVNDWFGELVKNGTFKHILLICGNHEGYAHDKKNEGIIDDETKKDNDYSISTKNLKKIMTNCIYLYEESIVLEGIKFYGIPWCPHLHESDKEYSKKDVGWYLTPKSIEKKWQLIPKDVDYLITHTPPFGILDVNDHGCRNLNKVLPNFKNLKVHQFGHCHGGYGWCMVEKKEWQKEVKKDEIRRVKQLSKKKDVTRKVEQGANILDDYTLFINAANASNMDLTEKIVNVQDDSFAEPIHFILPVLTKK